MQRIGASKQTISKLFATSSLRAMCTGKFNSPDRRSRNSNAERSPIGKPRTASRVLIWQKHPTVRSRNVESAYNLRSSQQQEDEGRAFDTRSNQNEDQRILHPEEFPDLNFHQTFGSYLTLRNPITKNVDPSIARYWDLLSTRPTLLQYHTHGIGEQYRIAFHSFFNADALSIHGHVSDASSAALLTSLISHVASHAPADRRVSFFSENDKISPRIAILEGSYGAGFGCLAYDAVLDSCRPLGNGPRPVVIQTNITSSIDAQIANARRKGCIAMITEIVRAKDGKVVCEKAWKNILKACQKHGLILVVDEALTAIRCGAPFACQLPQYAKHGLPDLILFGKAVRTNGVAIDWRGINIQKLGITDAEDRHFTILDWQERTTEMAQVADLLFSWGTILLAKQEDWPQRSVRIGEILRNIIVDEGVRESLIGGLHSLIYLRLLDNERLLSPVMGAKAGNHVRWFPVMDDVMMSADELRTKVFGESSLPHRREVAGYLRRHNMRLGYCSRCGEAVGDSIESCDACIVRKCEECEAGEHECPMVDSETRL